METSLFITAYTGMSAEDQAQFCFDSAYAWLEIVLETDPYGLEMLPLTPGFWPWWRTQWDSIDKAFQDSLKVMRDGNISIVLPGQSYPTYARGNRHLKMVWMEYHNPRYVIGNQNLMEQSFHNYIKSINQKSTVK